MVPVAVSAQDRRYSRPLRRAVQRNPGCAVRADPIAATLEQYQVDDADALTNSKRKVRGDRAGSSTTTAGRTWAWAALMSFSGSTCDEPSQSAQQ